jgi:hypothetical protein
MTDQFIAKKRKKEKKRKEKGKRKKGKEKGIYVAFFYLGQKQKDTMMLFTCINNI